MRYTETIKDKKTVNSNISWTVQTFNLIFNKTLTHYTHDTHFSIYVLCDIKFWMFNTFWRQLNNIWTFKKNWEKASNDKLLARQYLHKCTVKTSTIKQFPLLILKSFYNRHLECFSNFQCLQLKTKFIWEVFSKRSKLFLTEKYCF